MQVTFLGKLRGLKKRVVEFQSDSAHGQLLLLLHKYIQPTRTQHIVDDVIIVPLSTLRSMYLKGCVCRTREICASPDLMPSRGLL